MSPTPFRTRPARTMSPGRGNGIVDVFDLDLGNLIARAITGGVLNSPWGLDIAPSGLGEFADDLLAAILATARSMPSIPFPSPMSAR